MIDVINENYLYPNKSIALLYEKNPYYMLNLLHKLFEYLEKFSYRDICYANLFH